MMLSWLSWLPSPRRSTPAGSLCEQAIDKGGGERSGAIAVRISVQHQECFDRTAREECREVSKHHVRRYAWWPGGGRLMEQAGEARGFARGGWVETVAQIALDTRSRALQRATRPRKTLWRMGTLWPSRRISLFLYPDHNADLSVQLRCQNCQSGRAAAAHDTAQPLRISTITGTGAEEAARCRPGLECVPSRGVVCQGWLLGPDAFYVVIPAS
jgi:hypothetical protein